MFNLQSQKYGKQKAMPTQREDKRSLKHFFCAFMAMVCLLLLVSGCVLKEPPPERELEPLTIKVMGSDFSTLYSRYGAV